METEQGGANEAPADERAGTARNYGVRSLTWPCDRSRKSGVPSSPRGLALEDFEGLPDAGAMVNHLAQCPDHLVGVLVLEGVASDG